MQSVYDIVKSEGFELHQRGDRWRGICPLHDRDGRNPSFSCDDQHFTCFSCGEHGDGIAFIMKLRNLSFPQALAYLGEERRKPTRTQLAQQTRERRQRTEAVWRERELTRALGIVIRLCHNALRELTPENIEERAIILQELSHIEHQHSTLMYGTPEDKAAVVAEWQGIKLFKRNLLFNKNFDYRAWLGATLQKPEQPEVKGVTRNGTKRIKIHIERLQEGVPQVVSS